MAEASYLQLHGHDDDDDGYDDRDEVEVLSSHNNLSHDLDGFDVYPSDLDCPSSDDFLYRPDSNPTRVSPNENNSVLFDRENQVNFVIDMFHQRVEQSQSQSHSASRVIVESDLGNSDRSFGIIEGNEGMDSNDLEMDFGLGLGFPAGVDNNCNDGDDNSGFMVADRGDDFFVSMRARGGGARSGLGNQSSRSGGSEYFPGGFRVSDLGSDSDVARENEIDFGMDGDCDDESNLRLCLDAFQLEDDNDREYANANTNEDFEWEEVDGRIDEREVLSMIFDAEADLPGIPPDVELVDEEQTDASQWEVLLDAHNLEPNPDLTAGPYDEYNYAEYETVFGQFADNDAPSLGRPPASRTVVENLLSVVMTHEDVEKNNTLCAVCKDEIGVGLMAKQLPCAHWYHGDCIVPWLGIRNTCPVCRHELPTDDPDYERSKAERAARHH